MGGGSRADGHRHDRLSPRVDRAPAQRQPARVDAMRAAGVDAMRAMTVAPVGRSPAPPHSDMVGFSADPAIVAGCPTRR